MGDRQWIWPNAGPTPISQNMDSEMFDTENIPYSETIVREAIQNSLDARNPNNTEPVTIEFKFHEEELGEHRKFLNGVIEHRVKAQLSVPELWKKDKIKWLTVVDSNSTGLCGDLQKRTSDFWNYWLNFGQSNKDGRGRGGRGIGRVTFLISSAIHSVIGYTRRQEDNKCHACGMSVLKAIEDGDDYKSTHAYLALSENQSIYNLYSSDEFHSDLCSAFKLNSYSSGQYGLSLVIPYPHEKLSGDGILASAIEHFAPAIMNNTLKVIVDEKVLSSETIGFVAKKVCSHINDEAIKDDTDRYLDLIRHAETNDEFKIQLRDPSKNELRSHKDTELIKDIQQKVEADTKILFHIELPLTQDNEKKQVNLKAVVAKTPDRRRPIDRFYREGMCLPLVKSKIPGDYDLILLVDDLELATYLNLCEGKAHLDLLESTEIKEKLKDRGYRPGYQEKRFIKVLPTELRAIVSPDITQPDADVFNSYFSIPNELPSKKVPKKPGKNPPERPEGPPPPKPRMFNVITLKDGLRIEANPEYDDWPSNVSVTLAYADGSRKPSWSKFDFQLKDLEVSSANCEIEFVENKVRALNCNAGSEIEITGFDTRRELDTRIGVWKDA